MINKNVTSFYDVRWTNQIQRQRPVNRQRIQRIADAAIGKLGRNALPSVIDIGCGNGWALELLSRSLGDRCRLCGVEPSPVGAKNAAVKVPAANIICGTVDDLPTLEQFEVAICSEVIEHVDDQNAFIDTLSSIIKPGGWLVLTTPNGRYRTSYFEMTASVAQPVENWLDPAELQAKLARHFTVESYSTFDLSYWYTFHHVARRTRNVLRRIHGGWRTTQLLERIFIGRRGLYQFVVARRG